jgi:hypothetical protein
MVGFLQALNALRVTVQLKSVIVTRRRQGLTDKFWLGLFVGVNERRTDDMNRDAVREVRVDDGSKPRSFTRVGVDCDRL